MIHPNLEDGCVLQLRNVFNIEFTDPFPYSFVTALILPIVNSDDFYQKDDIIALFLIPSHAMQETLILDINCHYQPSLLAFSQITVSKNAMGLCVVLQKFF